MNKSDTASPKHLLAILFIFLAAGIYPLVNRPWGGSAQTMDTWIDSYIPIIELFVLPYLFWFIYVIGILIILGRRDLSTFYSTIAVMLIGYMICYIIYYFYPTQSLRAVELGNGWLANTLRLVYQFDSNYNCFPSLHCYTTHAIMFGVARSKITNKLFRSSVLVMGLIIIASTLLVKQHLLLDAVSAILICHVVSMVLFARMRKRKKGVEEIGRTDAIGG